MHHDIWRESGVIYLTIIWLLFIKKTPNISIEGLVPVSFEKLTGSQANRIAACYIIIAYLLFFSTNSNINHSITLPIIIYIISKTFQTLLFHHYALHPRTMHRHERIHPVY